MRVLLTGASGLLGLNMAVEVARRGHRTFGVVNHNRPTLQPTAAFPNSVTFLTADLLTPNTVSRLLDEIQPDWVIHTAALANVDACEQNPDLAYALNEQLPGTLARLAGRRDARLLHISSDAVFDGVRGNYTEDDLPNPLSVYAGSKLAGERAVLEACPEALVVRTNLFGWSRSGTRSLAEFFFNNLSAGIAVKGIRDVVFCPLLANELGDVLLRMLGAGLTGIYHVVSPDHVSKYEFGLGIARRFGLDDRLITPVSLRDAGLGAARSPNMTLRIEKLRTALARSSVSAGAAADTLPTWQSGLERLHDLYRAGYPLWLRS